MTHRAADPDSAPIVINPSRMTGGDPVTVPAEPDEAAGHLAARALARQKFDEAGGDRAAAVVELIGLVRRRPDLAAALERAAWRAFWEVLVANCASAERGRIARRAARDGADWVPDSETGAGLAAIRRNNETIFDYQWPTLGKKLGRATRAEFRATLAKIKHRHKTDAGLIAAGAEIEKQLAVGAKGATLAELIPAEQVIAIFRKHGIVS